MVEFFVNALRIVLIWIDKLIAQIIGMAYDLFIMIADTNIFNNDVLTEFSQRIYAILAIFMLFKMGLSLINYIVNPDDFTDKSKGAGKLVINILIVLVLIVSVPTLFSIAYDLQGKILKTNVIPQLVLGVGADLDSEDDETKPGAEMAYIVYTGFITPNPNYPGIGDQCKELYTAEETPTECLDFFEDQASAVEKDNLKQAVEKRNVQLLLDGDILNVNTNGVYFFSVLFIISSICGVIVAWVLLMFSIDIAIRVVKLGFLQLISPIPIISYIDPKSSKEGMFKKWMTETLSTYADLFIRLLAISFAIYLIDIIATGEITRISDPEEVISFTTHPLVKVLLLLGTLLFVQQLPKLIEDLTGKKMSGNFSLNPMKKIGESPFAAAAVGGTAGLVGGGLANAYKLGSDVRKEGFKKTMFGDKKGWKAAGHGMQQVFSPGAGAISAAIRSGRGAVDKKDIGKGVTGGIKGAVDARDLRDAREGAGYGFGTRTLDTIRGTAGVDTAAKGKGIDIKNKITNLKRQQSQYDRIAEEIAISRNLSPDDISKLAGGRVEVDAATSSRRIYNNDGSLRNVYSINSQEGKDIGKYVETVNKSTETSGLIVKESKKLRVYEAEDSKKSG